MNLFLNIYIYKIVARFVYLYVHVSKKSHQYHLREIVIRASQKHTLVSVQCSLLSYYKMQSKVVTFPENQ